MGRIQQVQHLGATSIHCCGPPTVNSSSQPFCVRFKIRLRKKMFLIRILQHSILSVWLTLTQAGSPPARQTDLASPHVQRFVLLRIASSGCFSFRLEVCKRLFAHSVPVGWYSPPDSIGNQVQLILSDRRIASNGIFSRRMTESRFPYDQTIVTPKHDRSIRFKCICV